tara:strand:+ start:105 stop:638 length:534 start_codon:yes stop_codon:yes gene_type:complete
MTVNTPETAKKIALAMAEAVEEQTGYSVSESTKTGPSKDWFMLSPAFLTRELLDRLQRADKYTIDSLEMYNSETPMGDGSTLREHNNTKLTLDKHGEELGITFAFNLFFKVGDDNQVHLIPTNIDIAFKDGRSWACKFNELVEDSEFTLSLFNVMEGALQYALKDELPKIIKEGKQG